MSADIKVTDGTILEALNNKVDIDFDNVASNSVSFARMSREVTNCITEIPQRIKYTLEDGTLTIKAGSVVIVPYGVEDLTSQYPKGATFLHENFKVYDTQFADGKFFVWVELVEDVLTRTEVKDSYERQMCINLSEIVVQGTTEMSSASEDYTGSNNQVLYHTSENIIKVYNMGVFTGFIMSLPILLCKANGTYMMSSVKQVFNGMGYIGSTVWVDKGVKGLIPNGRNEDGTLRNIECVIPKLTTSQVNMQAERMNMDIAYGLWLEGTGDLVELSLSGNYYDHSVQKDGYIYHNNKKWKSFKLGSYSCNSGVVTDFNPYPPFKAIDRYEASRLGMPSSKYIDLTLGASEAYYTAPGNGYFVCSLKSTASNQMLDMYINGLQTVVYSSATNQFISQYVPIKKGSTVKIKYTLSATGATLKFFYAEGEV